MKDQNEITDLIREFREKEAILPDNGSRVFREVSKSTEHDLLLLNRAFSWLFNTRGLKPSDTSYMTKRNV